MKTIRTLEELDAWVHKRLEELWCGWFCVDSYGVVYGESKYPYWDGDMWVCDYAYAPDSDVPDISSSIDFSKACYRIKRDKLQRVDGGDNET
jgi:hypothetical protein